MSDFSEAFAELMESYQDCTESAPSLTYDGNSVDIIPSSSELDTMFVGGGTANAGQFSVQIAVDALPSLPAEMETVDIADHATAPDGVYQVLSISHLEGCVMLRLGNADT